ncbi:hypothetical protein [Egicoccus sp. AB-alg2]|uniref:hypothetical protein n=1 Tax=Egicoccus sp. AB-alg2 TaxID=3242693 RepID=UPI00359ECAD8
MRHRRPTLALAALTAGLTALVPLGDTTAQAVEDPFAPGTRAAAEAAAGRAWSPPAAHQPPGVPTDRYALAGGCYALQSVATGGWVVRDDDGYAATARRHRDAERFHLQATDLGRYLLYGSDTHLVAIADGLVGELASDLPDTPVGGQLGGLSLGITDEVARELASGPLSTLTGRGRAVVAAASADVLADWELQASGRPGRFHLASVPLPDLHLVVANDGRVGLAEAAAADGADTVAFRRVDGCAGWPEVELGVEGPYVHAPTPTGATRGHLDAHLHGMAFEFLGGRARCGRPWHPYGVEAALRGCPEHDLLGGRTHVLETFLSGRDPVAGHDTTGWPTFVDWPAHDSLTYEQTYHRWLERAWRGGLRLYVNLLVDNNQLCNVHPYKHNSCNEMDGVRLQAQRLREFERYVDAQHGGPGRGWLRIVRDPFEARRVINEGRLAVVMGIEVSRLFDCGTVRGVARCTTDEIDARLAEVHDLGVRQMELVNKFDNAFSGVAGDSGQTGLLVNAANVLETGSFWRMGACPDHEHVHEGPRGGDDDYRGHDRTQPNLGDGAGVPDELVGRDALAGALLQAAGTSGVAPVYGPGPHCNELGLTDLGEHLLHRMMERGMLFDPDHMSVRARHEAMLVMEEADYSGVVSSHSWADDDFYRRILALGGVVTPMAGGSSGFVDAWRDLRGWADPRFGFGLGYGSDINGFATQGGPRGGEDPVIYPFEGFGGVSIDRQISGQRMFDVNVDGVAHYGLYPDWIEDLRRQAGEDIVADLERGPETYLQTWERALGGTPNACRADVAGLDDRARAGVRGGQPAEQVLLTLGQPAVRGHDAWTYCIDGGRRATVGFGSDGRVTDVEVVASDGAALPGEGADAPPAVGGEGAGPGAGGDGGAGAGDGGSAAGSAVESAGGTEPVADVAFDEHDHVHVATELASAPAGATSGRHPAPMIVLALGLAGVGIHALKDRHRAGTP